MNFNVLRINFWVLTFIVGFLTLENAFGFKCEIEKFDRCNIKLDSVNLAGPVNYEVKNIYFADFNSSENRIAHLTQSQFPICERFKNLKHFKIFEKHLKSVDENYLDHCKAIYEISLQFTNVAEIPENFFNKSNKLKRINLRENLLTTLPENLFINQRELKSLYLEFNNIEFLPPNVFKSLTKLHYLGLSANHLKNLNPQWFENLEGLRILYLTSNKIEELPKNVFKPLKNLSTLFLFKNKLTVIHSDSFGNLLNLDYIELGFNKINAIDEKIIDKGVKKIYMEKNICYDKNINKREKLKRELQNCFNNYQAEFPLPWNFTHQKDNNKCGIQKVPKFLVYKGSNTYHGEYPWNAVIVQNLNDNFCGGTLISEKAVVTAAHCMKLKQSDHVFKPSDFSILLGAHNLSIPNEQHRVTVLAKAIHIHPDWNVLVQVNEADIAVLEIENDIVFSKYIQPICLLSPYVRLRNTAEGVVAGYGYTESGNLARISQRLRIPIYDYHTCIINSEDHRSLISARTFCGGPGNGQGVCSGDSGTGLYTYSNGRYYLNGIVSFALTSDINGCNVDSYGIYTNVKDFYRWIMTGEKV